MIYAAILAAGLGQRMHRQDMPKQFLSLGDKPILIHTVEQFLINERIDKLIVAAPSDWMRYTEDLLAKYNFTEKEIVVMLGGANKTESIKKVTDWIAENYTIQDNDILVIHDAIRPFVTQRIINDNIDLAKQYGAANTSIETIDALLTSQNGKVIDEVLFHEVIYAEQTPQTYNLKTLIDVFNHAAATAIDLLTVSELPRLYISCGNTMHMVRGEYSNSKIVHPYDLRVANALLKEVRDD